MIYAKSLEQLINQRLNIEQFQDYAPNGRQVAGIDEIQTIVTGVTASQKLLDRAVELKAQAVLVHHGYFWKNESPVLTGIHYQRIKTLIQNNINLYAYHLPLDAEEELGNNAQLGQRLGFKIDPRSDPTDLLFTGTVETMTAEQLKQRIEERLQRTTLFSGALEGAWAGKTIRKVAWCTGGAQSYIDEAIARGCDAFISGEVSERTIHVARENGIYFYAAGHHATERYGIQALGEWLQRTQEVEVIFVDIDNPA